MTFKPGDKVLCIDDTKQPVIGLQMAAKSNRRVVTGRRQSRWANANGQRLRRPGLDDGQALPARRRPGDRLGLGDGQGQRHLRVAQTYG